MTFEEQFQDAGRDGKQFRGAPFWSWNDDLDPEELRRQVRSMCESGMGGFFMHARAGLITPYMSQDYFDCHQACIDEAKRLGMGAWLYDEDCWPSGSAGGVTPAKGPFYEVKSISLDRVKGGECEPDDNTVAVYSYTPDGDGISDFERLPTCTLREAGAGDLLHCRWKPGGYLDTLSEEAVAQFIDSTYDAFAKVFEADFGKIVPGIFTDEPNYRAVPWTLDFAEEFKSRMGYDIADKLPQVWFAVGDYRKPRHDFWRVATELYVQAFSKQIYDWCEEHKLELTGHQLCEDSLALQTQYVGATMPHYEYMQTPGIDHLCRHITDPELVKQVSSVAHQFGGRRVLSETFGCSGWNMSFEDQKWIAEWQYALGVNFMCQHLCLYSLKGWRKRDFPPSVYYQQPWWPRYNRVEDHFARLACALTMGKHVADVLLVHPIESAWAEYIPRQASPSVVKTNEDFVAVSRFLQEFHVDYDYGDESILDRHASVRDKQVVVGDASYNLIVLPPMTTLRKSTVKLLRTWIEQGGEVIVCGELPTMIDGEPTEELSVLLEDQKVVPVDFEALKEAVSASIEPRVQVLDEYGSDARTIYFHQRDLGGKQLFFLANIDNQDVRYDSVIRFFGSGKVEEWDLDTGEVAELACAEIGGHTVVEREFAPTQSRLLAFDPTQPPKIAEPERWMSADEVEIDGEWRVSRKDPNAATLDYCRYAVADGEFSELTPAIWLGGKLSQIEEETKVTLQYVFDAQFTEQKHRDFFLVMERPEQYEIKVNGNRVSYVDSGWWCDISFKKVDIDLFIQPGENVIEMTCNYLGEKGRKKRQAELRMPDVWKRMWTNPPEGVEDAILVPYAGETADKIKEFNYLKMGLDLESVYIIGDFAAYSTGPGKVVLKDGEPVVETGDLVDKGYCFFRGTVVYEGTFDYENRDEDKLLLALGRTGGIITKVLVNGEEAGEFKWRPMEVDLTGLVRPGRNELRMEITNSCRNLLGPHHNTGGELIMVGPWSFGAEAGYVGIEDHGHGDRPERSLQEWTDDYSFVETGLVTSPKLVYMRRE